MPEQTSSGPDGDRGRAPAIADDLDRPVDPAEARRRRHETAAGHGSLGDERAGYVMLSRRGWDGLMALRGAGALTHQDVVVVVGMLTRAGYRPESIGAVLGADGELAAAVGVPRKRILPACRSAQALGILDPISLPNERRVGWRFTREAWLWLVGEEDYPPPQAASARLAGPGTAR